MNRITLIHATCHSLAPIEAAFARDWPEARLTNILDDSLARDRAAAESIDERITERFLTLGRYAASVGTDAILFTCSAFRPCIEAVRADLAPLLVRGPYDAMITQAAAIGGRVALLATFAPTLQTMPGEFPSNIRVEPIYVEAALAALNAGDPQRHDQLVAEAIRGKQYDAVALAQYSLARAASAVAAVVDAPVLTTPNAAVQELRRALRAPQYGI
jgi:Asp/Glu/hydantoin racemase